MGNITEAFVACPIRKRPGYGYDDWHPDIPGAVAGNVLQEVERTTKGLPDGGAEIWWAQFNGEVPADTADMIVIMYKTFTVDEEGNVTATTANNQEDTVNNVNATRNFLQNKMGVVSTISNGDTRTAIMLKTMDDFMVAIGEPTVSADIAARFNLTPLV